MDFRRKSWAGVGAVCVSFLLLSSLLTAKGAAGTATPYTTQAQLQRSDDVQFLVNDSTIDHLLLELQTPQLEVDEIVLDGQSYVTLSAPGLDDEMPPGQPQLPHTSVLVGLPPTGGLSVRVVEVESELISLENPVVSAPIPRAVSPNHQTLEPRSGALPTAEAQCNLYAHLGDVAVVRDLRVARLSLCPFRYDSARGELEHVRRMVVEVRYDSPVQGAAPKPDAWDGLLEGSVVNYDVARAWRGVRSASIQATPNLPAAQANSFKVEVDADGLYQLTRADLQKAGFAVAGLDPRLLHLTQQGQEVALHIEGQADGSFDAGDRILFYGQAARSRYTHVNVYWLTLDGSPGLRMAQRDVTPGDAHPTPQAWPTSAHFEENNLYDPFFAEAEGDFWYWQDLAFLQTDCPAATQTYTFHLDRISPTAHVATLRSSLQAYTYGQHHLSVFVNDQHVGDLIWDGRTRLEGELAVDATLLSTGENTLRFENGNCPPPPPPSPPPNGVFFDYFELDYQASFTAAGDVLAFSGQAGAWQYVVKGFSDSDLLLFDVTDPLSPIHLVGPRTEPGYRLVFEDDAGAARRYLAQGQPALCSPLAFYQDTVSNLASPSNAADYLLIGHKDLLPAGQPLVDLRVAQGLQAMMVDVQDVYDEFSHGLLDPEAIRDLLAYALASWQLPPTYVLLLGDGTTDALDYLGQGWRNFVPAYLADLDPYLGETASDNLFAAVAGLDSLPDVYIGRLPVSSKQDTEAMVAKIVTYETASSRGPWYRRVLFASDNADSGGDFAALSDELYHNHLPRPFVGNRIYLSTDPDEAHEYDANDPSQTQAARSAVRTSIDRGLLLLNFMGHSSHDQWALEVLLHRDHVPALNNGNRWPVVLSMTCYTGAFHYPPYAPLDERLVLEPGRGAIAAWGPTGAGITVGHFYLSRGFFDALFADGLHTLGAATAAGKLEVYTHSSLSDYLVNTYVLLGDPATALDLDAEIVYGSYLPIIRK